MRKAKRVHDAIHVKGFLRVQIVDRKSKKVVGNSGWLENIITEYGSESCIVAAPIGANSVQAAGILLGSDGAAIASTAETLVSSLSQFWAAFANSAVVGSKTARVTCSFPGATKAPATLNNIGVFAVSSDTLLFGNTYDSSALTTDQDVNVSYDLVYS